MPKISPDGTTIIFKMFPHYFKLVEEGRKWATLRELDEKWLGLLNQARWIQFETIGSLTTTDVFRITNITEVPSFCRDLYRDCKWRWDNNTKLILIGFEGAVCVDFRGGTHEL